MIIVLFFIFHWYVSLFFQSFYNHRYAAHRMFTMNKFWEKFFFIGNWLGNGSSYLSPNTYAILHRLHHAHADTELDVHSPKYDKTLFRMMWRTRDEYLDVFYDRKEIDPKYKKNLPGWFKLDNIFEHIITRTVWVAIYATFFAFFVTAWWQWAFLPIVILMGPVHGAIINWFSHKVGYRNFKMEDTSTNMVPWDLVMWGEALHNNHHKRGSNPNFAYKKWEFDPMWPVIKVLDFVGIIHLKKSQKRDVAGVKLRLNAKEIGGLRNALSQIHLPEIHVKKLPEEKLQALMETWATLSKKDWKGDLNAYIQSIQARQAIHDFLESAGTNVKRKLSRILTPIDQSFQARMKPWDKSMLPKLPSFASAADHFWLKYSVYQPAA